MLHMQKHIYGGKFTVSVWDAVVCGVLRSISVAAGGRWAMAKATSQTHMATAWSAANSGENWCEMLGRTSRSSASWCAWANWPTRPTNCGAHETAIMAKW